VKTAAGFSDFPAVLPAHIGASSSWVFCLSSLNASTSTRYLRGIHKYHRKKSFQSSTYVNPYSITFLKEFQM
jgi:hypothetical protein